MLHPHIFLYDFKRRRAHAEHGLVEFFLGKCPARLFRPGPLQFQEFHIAHIVFQIIGRRSDDQVIDR